MSILIRGAHILVPSNNGFDVLKNAYLGISNGIIDYIGYDNPLKSPEKKYDEVKDFTGKMLIPGLVNAHTHTGMGLLRGLGSDLPLQEWLHVMWPIEDKMTERDLQVGMEHALLEMISSGTTSFTDMYMMPHAMIDIIGKSGLKANLSRVMQCFDPNQDYESYSRVHEARELFKKFNGSYDDRIRIDFDMHAEYTITEDIARKYSQECKKNNGRMHIHLSETEREVNTCKEKYNKSPFQWFNDIGTFDSPTLAAHCVVLSEEDMDILALKKVSVAHNPTSNLKLGSGVAPVLELLNRGVNVCLGTDGAASNNNLNMFEEMHLAAILHKGITKDPTVLPAYEVLKMATINGAKAQGRDDTGSLKVGKKADIVALDLNKAHLIPYSDLISNLTYSAQGSDVYMTMVNGNILYENGVFLTLDEERILEETKRVVKNLVE